MKKLSKKQSEFVAKVAADILIAFTFVRNMEDFLKVYNEVYKQYGLCDDPFTHLPCSPSEYAENSVEYERQLMIERYGHCDGLD